VQAEALSSPEPTEIEATELVQVLPGAQVRRELAEVWAGPSLNGGGDLSLLDDGDWVALEADGWVVTDENGEGWIDFKVEGVDCLRIFVFHSSKLSKAPCPKSVYEGANVACHVEGTDAFHNTCASQVVIQTLSADIVPEGTWLSVTYLPDRSLTLVLILEGQTMIQPVLDLEARTLGAEVEVKAGQFLFTMPDDRLSQVGSLDPRQVHPLTELPTVLDDLGLRPWIYKIRSRAEQDVGVQLDVPPVIVSIDFPEQIPSDTSRANPAPWTVHFRDPDGDLASKEAVVLSQETEGGFIFEPFSSAVGPERIQEGDEREGAVLLEAWCNGGVGEAVYELSLIDEAGYRSLPVEFIFRCGVAPPP
jgi:hypothetical protein